MQKTFSDCLVGDFLSAQPMLLKGHNLWEAKGAKLGLQCIDAAMGGNTKEKKTMAMRIMQALCVPHCKMMIATDCSLAMLRLLLHCL